MATFVIGQPINTPEPVITVDAGLRPGVHRFQLEVVTADRRVSKPDVVDVTIVDLTLPPRQPVVPGTILDLPDSVLRPRIDPIRTPVIPVPTRPTRPTRPIDGD